MKKFFTKIKTWFINHKPTKRRIIQLYVALLYNANIKGFFNGLIYDGPTKSLCVPGLNCYSCPGAIGACPLGSLQNALISAENRWPVYVLGILALFGLMLARTVCAFTLAKISFPLASLSNPSAWITAGLFFIIMYLYYLKSMMKSEKGQVIK